MDPCCPPDDRAPAPAPTGPLTGPEAEEELAAYTKALGHPARVHILTHLRAQRACIAGELADQLPLAPSTVSRHLKVLKDAGLITGEIDGPRRCYCVDTTALARFQALVAAL